MKILLSFFLLFCLALPVQTLAQIPPEEIRAFQNQVGLGGSVIPVYSLWAVSSSHSVFVQGGFQLDVLFRLHPKITMEVSLSGTGAKQDTGSYTEFTTIFGFRAYLRSPPQNWAVFHLAPYFAFALQQMFFASTTTDNVTPQGLIDPGLQVGGGVEIRLNQHLMLQADLRSLLRANSLLSSPSGLLGFRVALGFVYFF